MNDAREDVRNLFHAQGLTGGYREFGERPTAPRPAIPPQVPQAPHQQPTDSEPRTRRLDLVRSAPDDAPRNAPPSPLKGLFDRLAELGTREPKPVDSDDDGATDLMHMPLAELFELLESRSGRQ